MRDLEGAMAKSAQKKKKIELEPDAWARFERAIDVVAKSPPQHRVKRKSNVAKSREPKRSKRK